MRKSLILLGFFFSLILSQKIYAGAVISSLNGLYYGQSVESQDKSKIETKQTLLSMNLSYLTNDKMIFGVLGFNDSLDKDQNIEKTSGLGAQLGFLIGSWGVEVFVLSQVEYQPNSSDKAKWTDGTGYQLDLVYYSIQSPGIFWGFQWVYRVLDLKKYNSGSVIDDNKKTIIQTFPQIKVGYVF